MDSISHRFPEISVMKALSSPTLVILLYVSCREISISPRSVSTCQYENPRCSFKLLIFLILGVSSAILPMNVSSTYLYDIGMLIAVMVLTYLPIAKTKKVTRGMGITMVLVYVAYTVYLIMR